MAVRHITSCLWTVVSTSLSSTVFKTLPLLKWTWLPVFLRTPWFLTMKLKLQAMCAFWFIWGSGVTQGHKKRSHSIEHDFLFDYNRNYASILYRFRLRARLSLKVADFNPHYLHLSPHRGWSNSNLAVIFGVRKLESWGYREALFAWSYV